MKIEIKFDDPKIQASFCWLKDRKTALISIYFQTGDRYEHGIGCITIGSGNVEYFIEPSDPESENPSGGKVIFKGETPEEIDLFQKGQSFESRDKETIYILWITEVAREIEKDTFIYERTF